MRHVLSTLLCGATTIASAMDATPPETTPPPTTGAIQQPSTAISIDQPAWTNLMDAVGQSIANFAATSAFETAADRSVILPTNRLIGIYAMLNAAYGQTDRTSVVWQIHAAKVDITGQWATIPVNFRVLLRGQTNPADNGLYIVQADHRLARDTTQENRFISHLGYGLIVSLENTLNMCLYYPALHQFVDIGQAPTAP